MGIDIDIGIDIDSDRDIDIGEAICIYIHRCEKNGSHLHAKPWPTAPTSP